MQAFHFSDAVKLVAKEHPEAFAMALVDGAVTYKGVKFTVLKAKDAYAASKAKNWKQSVRGGLLALSAAAATSAYAIWRWKSGYQVVLNDIRKKSYRPVGGVEFGYTAETSNGNNEYRIQAQERRPDKYPRTIVEVKGYPGKEFNLLDQLTCSEYQDCNPELGPDVQRALSSCEEAVNPAKCQVAAHATVANCQADGGRSWSCEGVSSTDDLKIREFVKQKYCNWFGQCDYDAPLDLKAWSKQRAETFRFSLWSPHNLGYQDQF